MLGVNKKRQYRYIIDVYNTVKQEDIPDTHIVRVVFPKHHIFISYRQWTRIKGRKPSEVSENQLSLF
jgi:hypothetical protein